MTPELKPCPFCGEVEDLHLDLTVGELSLAIHCFVCGAVGPIQPASAKYQKEAIEAWNKRSGARPVKDLGTIEFNDGLDE